jgi:hypothetical protein
VTDLSNVGKQTCRKKDNERERERDIKEEKRKKSLCERE